MFTLHEVNILSSKEFEQSVRAVSTSQGDGIRPSPDLHKQNLLIFPYIGGLQIKLQLLGTMLDGHRFCIATLILGLNICCE